MGTVGRHTMLKSTQVKNLYIFRSIKGGQLPRERRAVGAREVDVGRFLAPHTPEMPINTAFFVLQPWTFNKKRPKLPLFEVTIRGPKWKKGACVHVSMGDCHPFWMKNEKVSRLCFSIGKII
jgi:hypothetical protein